MLPIHITRTNSAFNDIPLPEYATAGSAGMDVHAAIEESLLLTPQQIALVPTALAIAIPTGYECQVRSRSGLAAKHGIICLNAPGTIDSDYRGEIKVILMNLGSETFTINRGDRIAQLVVAHYQNVEWVRVDELPQSQRGDGGFGSTGI